MQPNQPNDYWQQADETLAAESEQPANQLEQPVEQPEQADAGFQPIQWRASEYVHHDKQAMWFVGLVVAAIVLLVVAVFLIKSYTFALLIIVMAVAVGYMARRAPHEVSYQLTGDSVIVGDKAFPYQGFSGFGVISEGALYSVVLIPTKRFSPSVSIYFPENLGEQIVDVLGSILPMRDIKPDPVDKLSQKLRF